MTDLPSGPGPQVPSRQPIFNIPPPVIGVIGGLVLIHLLRELGPQTWDEAALLKLAFVPGRLTYGFAPQSVTDAMLALARQGAEGYRQAQIDRFFLGDGTAQAWTSLTYALLHASWTHLGLNAVWLLAFGTPLARRVGALRFAALLVAAAVAGAVVHYLAHPLDLQPVIGASAAVSGCMGASLRFVFQPRDRVPVMPGARPEAPPMRSPALTLRQVFGERRAVTFLVAWFGTNLLFGVASVSFAAGSGPVAWEAHIGGFAAGLLLFALFDPARAPRASRDAEEPPAAPDRPAGP